MMKHALRKKELCESVMNVMDKIIPGRFRLRGMFLSEMYGILLFLAKRAYENGDIDREEFITRLEGAKEVLEESIEVRTTAVDDLFKLLLSRYCPTSHRKLWKESVVKPPENFVYSSQK